MCWGGHEPGRAADTPHVSRAPAHPPRLKHQQEHPPHRHPPPRMEAVMRTTSTSMRRTAGKRLACMGLVMEKVEYAASSSSRCSLPAM